MVSNFVVVKIVLNIFKFEVKLDSGGPYKALKLMEIDLSLEAILKAFEPFLELFAILVRASLFYFFIKEFIVDVAFDPFAIFF